MDFGTLAGALVVGLSGGFLGTYASTRVVRSEGERQREHDRAEAERQREHEQRERLRERQINAADDFLRAVTSVVSDTAVLESWCFQVRDDRERLQRDERAHEAGERFKALVQEVMMHSQRLRLVFPEAVYETSYSVLTASADVMTKLFDYLPPGGCTEQYGPQAQKEIDAVRGQLAEASTAFQVAAVAVTRI